MDFLRREILRYKVTNLNFLIRPVFKNFGVITKEKNPKEYFILSALNKIYSINVSLENIIFTNDIFLSIYIYRYVYELYIKIFYIFSGKSEVEILGRINDFFVDGPSTAKIHHCEKYLDKRFVPSKVTRDHAKKYKIMSKFVHPNLASLALHYQDRKQQFEFLIPNINLSVWLLVDLIRFFLKSGLIIGVDDSKLSDIQKIN